MTVDGIVVDVISAAVDVGQLASLASKLGYTAIVEPAERDRVEGYQVRFVLRREEWGQHELVNLAVIYAYVYGKSGNQVLDVIRAELERRDFPLDKPVQDAYSIGAGDHKHEDDETDPGRAT